MKYLLLGLILLFAIWGFCLWSGNRITQEFEPVIRSLEQACRSAEDSAGEARQLTARAQNAWAEAYPRLAACLDHNDMDDVSLAFASLEDAQDEDVLPTLKALLSMLRNLAEADLPLPHNLL